MSDHRNDDDNQSDSADTPEPTAPEPTSSGQPSAAARAAHQTRQSRLRLNWLIFLLLVSGTWFMVDGIDAKIVRFEGYPVMGFLPGSTVSGYPAGASYGSTTDFSTIELPAQNWWQAFEMYEITIGLVLFGLGIAGLLGKFLLNARPRPS